MSTPKVPLIRTRWDRSRRTVIMGDEHLSEKERAKVSTQQQFKDEVNINTIVGKAIKNGFLPPSQKQAIYMDLTEMPQSLEEAHDLIASAQESFMQLPAAVRLELDNNPAAFEHQSEDWYIKHGFLPQKEVPAVTPPAAGSEGGTPSPTKGAKAPKEE